MTSERELIRRLAQRFPVRPPLVVGIGDDGAVIDCRDAGQQVVVADMLLDRVHFDLRQTSPTLAGRKAVAVNLSDLAAMACRPTAAFVSLALPKSLTSPDEFLTQLYDGIEQLAACYEFSVAGGDTNVWDGPFAINVCLTGVPMGDQSVLRSGAKPGDVLLVTGPLGGSLTSDRHLAFEPRLHLSRWLVENSHVHAMIDISDGLAIDLHRLAEASGIGAVLAADHIPVHSDVSANLSPEVRLQHALSDGEDFELLLAMTSSDLEKLKPLPHGQALHVVGTVTDGTGVYLTDASGNRRPLQESGWQHF